MLYSHHHHHHEPDLLQTSAIMAFQSSLLSVLLMNSLLRDSFLVQSCSDCLYNLCVISLCFWYHKSFHSIFAFLCPKICSCLFLMVLSRDLLYPTFSITSWFDFFTVHVILIILLMYHISAALSLLSRSFVSIQHSHPCRRMDHMQAFRVLILV